VEFVYDDGGREGAGYRGNAGDCVVRAIAIATEQPYQVVYDALHDAGRDYKFRSRRARVKRGSASPRDGVHPAVYKPYLLALGWEWVPTMQIGSGCRVHLRADELPAGRLIVRLSGHLSAVINSVIHDTNDPSREGTRCVYGYWRPQ
jgi:hypothetical protein